MNIEFKQIGSKFQLENYVLRDINEYYGEKGQLQVVPHFQAILKDNRQFRKGNLYFLLTYYDENGNFKGFDEHVWWSGVQSRSLSISMPITIPENTVKAIFTVEEQKYKDNNEFVGLLILIIILFFVGFAIKYFFE